MEFANPSIDRDTIQLLKRWLENKNNNKSFCDYFATAGYKTIGIMDAGEIGRILYDELRNSKIEIKWFIDKNAEGISAIDGIPVRLMKDIFGLPMVDIICVSPIYDYESVNAFLTKHNPEIHTINLKDAAYEM